MHPGDLISGKYRLLRQLGSGGMGSVWAVRNELTDRDFAIKFLLPNLAENKEALQRFFHEAKACGQIKHPAVVNVYDMGQAEDGAPYLVMELLEGEGFDQRLARSKVFRAAEAAAWISFVARGLEEAHMRGLVHRDLKPGNIFFALDERGEVVPKLLDFGVSKAVGTTDDFIKTTTGAVLGSPAYMSPEQAKGELEIDARSDIWSLGVILYEALTGRVPFDAPNYNALMVTIMMQPHVSISEIDPSVPKELAAVVDDAMAKERDERISTAREFADRLDVIVSRITNTPFPQLMPKFDQARTSTYRSVPPPKAPGKAPHAETQGSWTDQKSTPPRRRSTAPGGMSPHSWMIVGIVSVALVVLGILAFVRLQPPQVAVAGRAAIALSTGLIRLENEVDRIQEEVAKEESARGAEDDKKAAGLTLGPEDLPPAEDDPPKPRGPSRFPQKPRDDPHGGVEGPGF